MFVDLDLWKETVIIMRLKKKKKTTISYFVLWFKTLKPNKIPTHME